MATIISKTDFLDPTSKELGYYFTLESFLDNNESVVFEIEVSREIFHKYQEHDTIEL